MASAQPINYQALVKSQQSTIKQLDETLQARMERFRELVEAREERSEKMQEIYDLLHTNTEEVQRCAAFMTSDDTLEELRQLYLTATGLKDRKADLTELPTVIEMIANRRNEHIKKEGLSELLETAPEDLDGVMVMKEALAALKLTPTRGASNSSSDPVNNSKTQ